MSSLHDRLEELLTDVPSVVHADVAGAATEGRRRRVRRRVASVGVGALVVLVAALSVLVLPGSRVDRDLPADTRPVVDGYPTQVRAHAHLDPLPDAPGPLAGVVQAAPDDAWMVVSATGQAWRLPSSTQVQPALSPDGTRLAYVPRGRGMVVRDLVSGDVTRVGPRAAGSRSGGWELDLDSTLRWSTDSRSLAMLATRDGTPGQRLLVSLGNGLVDLGPADLLPGWSSRDSVVALRQVGRTDRFTVRELEIASRGRFIARPGPGSLRLPDTPLPNQVSIDRRGRLLLLGRSVARPASLTTYDLTRGAQVDRRSPVPGVFAVSCQWGSDGDSPAYLSNDGYADGQRGALVDDTGRRLVTFDPRASTWCASFATEALEGVPHRDPLARALGVVGLDQSWVYWRWRELSLGVLVVGLLPLLVAAARRSARSRAILVLDAVVSLSVTAGVTAGVVRDRFVLQSSGADLVVHFLPACALLALLWVLPVRDRSAPRLAAVAVALLAAVDPSGEIWPWLALLGMVCGLGPVLWRGVRPRTVSA